MHGWAASNGSERNNVNAKNNRENAELNGFPKWIVEYDPSTPVYVSHGMHGQWPNDQGEHEISTHMPLTPGTPTSCVMLRDIAELQYEI